MNLVLSKHAAILITLICAMNVFLNANAATVPARLEHNDHFYRTESTREQVNLSFSFAESDTETPCEKAENNHAGNVLSVDHESRHINFYFIRQAVHSRKMVSLAFHTKVLVSGTIHKSSKSGILRI